MCEWGAQNILKLKAKFEKEKFPFHPVSSVVPLPKLPPAQLLLPGGQMKGGG